SFSSCPFVPSFLRGSKAKAGDQQTFISETSPVTPGGYRHVKNYIKLVSSFAHWQIGTLFYYCCIPCIAPCDPSVSFFMSFLLKSDISIFPKRNEKVKRIWGTSGRRCVVCI